MEAEECGENKYNYSLLTHFELTGIMKCSAGGSGRIGSVAKI
jgi:hypothetical protein